jgi:hypothetical protein
MLVRWAAGRAKLAIQRLAIDGARTQVNSVNAFGNRGFSEHRGIGNQRFVGRSRRGLSAAASTLRAARVIAARKL